MLKYCFFLQSSRYVSNEQSCLRTIGLYDDLLLLFSLFHFFYFIFSVPISFHSVFPFSLCFPIPPILSLSFFFYFSYTAFIKCSRKAFVYIYKNMYNIYISFTKLISFCLIKKIMTFWFHLFDLVWIEFEISNLRNRCATG